MLLHVFPGKGQIQAEWHFCTSISAAETLWWGKEAVSNYKTHNTRG